jgi:Spy/CpxP family protein refolding chaperone
MKRSTFPIILYLLLVFASGALVGGFAHRLYTTKSVKANTAKPSGPEDYRKKYMAEMQGRLKLSAEQVQKLTVILDDTRSKFREVRERMDPEMKQIQEDQRNQIRGILSKEQTDEYEKLLAEKERRSREARKSHGGGGC